MRLRALLLLGVACVLVQPAFGQEAGDIRGTFDEPVFPAPMTADAPRNAAKTKPGRTGNSVYEPDSADASAGETPDFATLQPGADAGADIGAGEPSLVTKRSGSAPIRPSTRRAAARERAARQDVDGRSAGNDRDRQPAASVPEPDAADGDDALQTATAREGPSERVGTDEEFTAAPRASEPIEQPPRRAVDESPYAPLGIRTGTFTWLPSIETGVNTTIENGESTVASQTTLRVNGSSDWSRHALSLGGFLRYETPFSGESADEIEFGGDLAAGMDFAGGFRGTFSGSINRQREDATAPVDFTGTVDRPYRTLANAGIGLEKTLGKLEAGARVSLERADYEDGTLSTGGTFSQEDRNNTLVTAALRAGYEISPALTPFVEAEVGRRIYDLDADRNGYARNAQRLGLRAGLAFDLSEKLNGEVSAGWLRESFEDDRLDAVSGLRLDSTVNWSPARGTLVSLDVGTEIEGTTTPGSSGSLLYNADISFSREIMANVIAEGRLGAAYRDFSGSDSHEYIMRAEAGGTWWMNRHLGLTARASYERTWASGAARDTDTATFFAGIRAQR